MKKPIKQLSIKSLKHLASELQIVMTASGGEWTLHALRIANRIKELIAGFRFRISSRELRRALGSLTVFFSIGYGQIANAQIFSAGQVNPNGIVGNYFVSIPVFTDIDGDGDLDMFATDITGIYTYTPQHHLRFFENIGTPASPSFATPIDSPFGLPSHALTFTHNALAIADMDGDGDSDIMLFVFPLNTYNIDLLYYENTGSGTNPQFSAALTNPWGATYTGIFTDIADLDGDGDLDLISSHGYGVSFFENTGTVNTPQFATSVNTSILAYYLGGLALGDCDSDGDLDLIFGDYYGDLHYAENIGTSTSYQFGNHIKNPSGLHGVSVDYFAYPSFADLDGDGDEDLMVGHRADVSYSLADFVFFENQDTSSSNGGMSLEDLLTGVNVYPSLTDGILNIESSFNIKSIYILNQNGEKLKQFSGAEDQIDIKDMSKGIYLVQLETMSGELITRRVYKQ